MKKVGLAFAFAAVIAFTFAGCSNAAGGVDSNGGSESVTGNGTGNGAESGGGSTELPAKPWLTAKAVSGGIEFTIKALGAQYNDETDCFIYSQQPSDIGRFYPEWNDKTKEWKGVYPYVTAGQTYKFQLHINNLQDETITVKATDGLGQIAYDANTSASISVDNKSVDVFVNKCPPSVIPSGVTNKKAFTSFFAGEWSTTTWDGTWIDYLEKAEADFAQPDSSGNCVYKIASTTNLYKNLKTAMTGKYSGKRMFVEFTYRYKVDGFPAECHSRQLRSAPMLPVWAAPENESAHFKAETVSGGVRLTIKKSAASTAYAAGNQIFVFQNGCNKTYDEIGRIFPDWSNKSQDWVGVYPLVDKGKTYQFRFQSFDDSMCEIVKCKAGGGSGEIQYANNPYVHFGLSASNTNVAVVDYLPSLIPSSATEKKAFMQYYAGTGWNESTQTWDGEIVLNRWETNLAELENGACNYSIMSSDADYTTIKNKMNEDEFKAKKLFVLFTYNFKLAGISGDCRARILQSEPVDASALRSVKTYKDEQSAGDENASRAETSIFSAEAVEGGIKLTVKKFSHTQKVKLPMISVYDIGAGNAENILFLDGSIGDSVWTCVYPYVTAGDSYTIVLKANAGLAVQTLTLKASFGVGVIPKTGSLSVAVASDKITASINDYTVNDRIPGGTSGLNNKETRLAFYAGEGWIQDTYTWDAEWITDFAKSGYVTTLTIPYTNSVYTTLRNKMTGTYSGKKLFIQAVYSFRKSDIPAEIRICLWEAHVATADMHWN